MSKKAFVLMIGAILLLTLLISGRPPAVLADATCSSPLAVSTDTPQNLTISSLRCFRVQIGRNTAILAVKMVPTSGSQFDLYLGQSNQLSSADNKMNLFGPINRRATFAVKNPAAGNYIIAILPTARQSSLNLTLSTGVVTSSTPPSHCSGNICSTTQPLSTISDVSLSAEFGDKVIIPLTVACPGTIRATADWSGPAKDLALIVNGPERPQLLNPVAYYAREDGHSPLSIEYNVTPQDVQRGQRWQISLVNFSGHEVSSGNIKVSYPDPATCPARPAVIPTADEMLGASSWGAGRLVVAARGHDNALWVRWRDGRAWQNWTSLGGKITSAPTSGGVWGGQLDIFALGTDKALWHRRNYKDKWQDWASLGGSFSSTPAVISWQNRLDVFVRGTDNALWHRRQQDGRWLDWVSLGGTLSSAPAAVSWGDNRIDVFARSTDNALWHRSQDGGRWSNWESLGGVITSAPAAAAPQKNSLIVFARGLDNALWQRSFNGKWANWSSLGGTLTSAPAAGVWSQGQIVVFARGANNALLQRTFDGQWQDWKSFESLP
jgi:hypothetical protein